jgi:hypothetical protein
MRLSILSASVIRDLIFFQFPSGQFIFDGVGQTLVESGNQGLRIPPTLGGEGGELNGVRRLGGRRLVAARQ